MDVAVHRQHRPEVANQAKKSNKPDMRGVFGLGRAERRRVRHQDVELSSAADAFEAERYLESQRPATHLALAVLVRPFLVAQASSEPGHAGAWGSDHATVDVDAPLRPRARKLRAQRHPGHVRRLEAWVVVAGYVQQRNVEAADEILEVVEGQVPAAEDHVRPER